VLSVILITGFIFTKLAQKLHIPIVTAQIVGGIVLGSYVLNLFQEEAFFSLVPITNFALGFIGLTIGSHLDFRKLHNAGKRIFLISITDVIITPIIVFLLYLSGSSSICHKFDCSCHIYHNRSGLDSSYR